ncbi:MAG: hypothetical protein IPH81_20315 [Candidatus Microthrix sp.]|nr:hypothetical protein [Candidatus Microthrix sp.]
MPFLSVSLIGFVSLAGIMYEQTYNLDELQRGYLAASVEPFQFIGLAMGAAMGTKLFLRGPGLVFQVFCGWSPSPPGCLRRRLLAPTVG